MVNAANTSLLGGGGVDGAIHRRGGPEILEACKAIRARQGGCPTGAAVLTTAGDLPARFVIHTVGPVWRGGGENERELLAACYRSSLRLCAEHALQTVAFPNISTGIYGFPKPEAARIALQIVRADGVPPTLREIVFVCFDWENHRLYQRLLSAWPQTN